MTDAPLSQIGKYQLTDVLGQGAMGVVYRALDPLINRYVALKLMSQGIAADSGLRDRFLREARAAGSLQHPNIITIFDFGDADGHLYIAMEFIEGADLSELIDRQDPLPLPGKLDIIIDVLQALDYAHARGVVHRDIKPANIRVGVDGRAKLMDFGIARLESSELTKTGMLIGTPHYMAPEQVSGGAITPATDVFAMGVVLYEFLTYSKAFGGDSLTAVLYQVVAAEPPSFSNVAPAIPPALQAIVQKALSKDPSGRYSSAGRMASALADVRTALSGGAPVTIHARRTPLLGTLLEIEPPLPARSAAGPSVTRSELPATPPRKWPFPIGIAAASLAVVTLLSAVAYVAIKSDATRGEVAAADAPAPTPPAAQPAESITAVAPARGARTPQAPAPATPPARDSRPPTTAQSQVRPATPLAPPQAPPAQPAAETTAAATRPAPTPPAPVPAPAPPASPAPQAAPVPPAPVDHRPAIEQLVAAYARAIESRSVDQIRRAYPGLTGSQEQGWQQFFASVRNIRTRLSVTDLDIEGARASIAVAGSHEYEAGGRAQQQPVSFRAVATLDDGAWKLTQIR